MVAQSLSHDGLLALERRQRRRGLGWGLVAAVVVAASTWHSGLFDVARLADGLPAIATLGAEMWPPDFSSAADWVVPLLDTLAMSVAGTALAIVLSLPLGVLAAANVAPNAAVRQAARLALNALRAVPELIFGMVLVAAVGFGALPGVLALGLHSIGMIGKFFAEAIEHVDAGPVEAARAAGATPLQVVVHAVLPQVLPQMADVALYRWEYNFRASTVLGTVGAGGIGFELIGALRILDYRQVLAIMLVVLVVVTLVDAIGSRLRQRLR